MPMKRIRTIKPEFFTSEDITSLPFEVRLTFIGLWLYADDFGRENARASLVRAAVWPEDDMTVADIDEHLLRLTEGGQIALYTVGDRTYFQIVNWAKHQRVDKPSKSNVPAPPEGVARDSRPGDLIDGDPLAMEGRGEGDAGESGEGVAADEASARDAREAPATISRERAAPSPFCATHPDGTARACRACGNARMKRKLWDDSVAEQLELAAERAAGDL